jgi:hypothetical protein
MPSTVRELARHSVSLSASLSYMCGCGCGCGFVEWIVGLCMTTVRLRGRVSVLYCVL